MGLLDKLRPQPRWRHADSAIRFDALRELDDQIELGDLAENDTDPRIRRSALARVADPACLGRIASSDPDEETRDRAAERLALIATDPSTDEATAVQAVRFVTDPRRLATVAKTDAPDAVRELALAGTTDERALGGIARNARQESTAQAALDRLTDAGEVQNVAFNGSHRDVALRAFDRIVEAGADLALLRSIETRAQQKAVVKKARAMAQEIEDAEAARRAAVEERRRQAAALIAAARQVTDVTDIPAATAELARITDAWTALEGLDADQLAEFERSTMDAREAMTRRRREEEDALERARLRAEALATRDALCLRVETLEGHDMLEQLAPIEEEWRSLAPLVGDGPEADRLAGRFAMAIAACRRRHELRGVLAATHADLEARVTEAEGLLSAEDAAGADGRWPTLAREAETLAGTLNEGGQPASDLADRLAAVGQAFQAREAGRREAADKARQDLVGRLQRLAERCRRVVEADAITLREGDRLMRDVVAALDEASHAGDQDRRDKDIDEAARALRTLQEQVAPRIRELRELDDWRRFANGQQQEQFIAMAEAIVSSLKSDEEAGKEADIVATARALKELHAKWQSVAEGPRHHAQRLWDRFRTATDFIRLRCEGYFAKLREERGENLLKKTAIVEEAEALASSTDWGKAVARFQALQTEWPGIGPVPRDAARDLAHRFRAACNQFFSRRREDMASRKKVWAENLARKEAICERAEALAESTEWDSASAEMKRLQAEWKTIGAVNRHKSEAIWNRFRAAADRFFERYHNRHRLAVEGRIQEREAMVVELEQLAASESPVEDLAARVAELRAAWSRTAPVQASEMRQLTDRWHAALSQLIERRADAFKGTDLDAGAVLQRMEKLVARVEALMKDAAAASDEGRTQAEILAARLRSALASNAMGGRNNEDARWRAAAETVRDAQASWQRLVPIPGSEARALEARFREACRRVGEYARRHTNSQKRSANRPTPAAV